MTREELFEAINNIEDGYIEEASVPPVRRNTPIWGKLACAAAAAAAILISGFFPTAHNNVVPKDYQIMKLEGTYYLKVDNPLYHTPSNFLASSRPSSAVYFDSLEEMRSDLIFHNFTEYERSCIRLMECNKAGLTQLPDLSNLYAPVCPPEFKLSCVIWDGAYYGLSLKTEDSELRSSLTPITEEAFNSNRDFLMDFKGYRPSVVTEKVYDAERDVTVYYTESTVNGYKSKCVVYTITTDTKTVYAIEDYVHATDTMPYSIDFYGKEDGVCFRGWLSDFTEIPSKEYIASFGLTEFDP